MLHPETRKVGRYEILEVIGVGANSRVARAFDPLIARIVAIKLFPSELASPANSPAARRAIALCKRPALSDRSRILR